MKKHILNRIDDMLKNPECLSVSELLWVKRIDRTLARYADPEPTRRQILVIENIYGKFQLRTNGLHAPEDPISVMRHPQSPVHIRSNRINGGHTQNDRVSKPGREGNTIEFTCYFAGAVSEDVN